MSHRQYRDVEDPTEICCGQCGRWHSAPACDAWRWEPAPVRVAYLLADGSACVSRGRVTGFRTAIERINTDLYLTVDHMAVDWEDLVF